MGGQESGGGSTRACRAVRQGDMRIQRIGGGGWGGGL